MVHATRWISTKAIPVNYEPVCEQVNETLRQYGINTLYGDQFCFPILRQRFLKLGVNYKECTFGTHTRASIYGNLRQLMAQRKIGIIDHAELERQLLSLEEITTSNGSTDIRPPCASKDDLAICVALAASKLANADTGATPFMLGEVDRYLDLGLIPGCCRIEAICANCQDCIDAGRCLHFRDQRRT